MRFLPFAILMVIVLATIAMFARCQVERSRDCRSICEPEDYRLGITFGTANCWCEINGKPVLKKVLQ